mmetsp:Transcript_11776/g.35321  ORF Transcript_11776/g.35321 Transcript_11776/m.35321 type:complete len:407 (+) Transcript_11776:793-2013(+)
MIAGVTRASFSPSSRRASSSSTEPTSRRSAPRSSRSRPPATAPGPAASSRPRSAAPSPSSSAESTPDARTPNCASATASTSTTPASPPPSTSIARTGPTTTSNSSSGRPRFLLRTLLPAVHLPPSSSPPTRGDSPVYSRKMGGERCEIEGALKKSRGGKRPGAHKSDRRKTKGTTTATTTKKEQGRKGGRRNQGTHESALAGAEAEEEAGGEAGAGGDVEGDDLVELVVDGLEVLLVEAAVVVDVEGLVEVLFDLGVVDGDVAVVVEGLQEAEEGADGDGHGLADFFGGEARAVARAEAPTYFRRHARRDEVADLGAHHLQGFVDALGAGGDVGGGGCLFLRQSQREHRVLGVDLPVPVQIQRRERAQLRAQLGHLLLLVPQRLFLLVLFLGRRPAEPPALRRRLV